MKLLQRIVRYQLAVTVPMVVLGTVIGYAMVTALVKEEVDEQLEVQAERIAAELQKGQRTFNSNAPDVFIEVANGSMPAALFKDTIMFNAAEQEDLPWRFGRVPVELPDGSRRVITVGRSLANTDEMTGAIALGLAALLAAMTLGNALLNRRLSRSLWRPFHHSLVQIQRFEVGGSQVPELPDTEVDEFTGLNRALSAMMVKLRADHTAQKRFTEQAAHELQTPLAIMQGKLDQLIQSPRLGEHEADLIAGIFQARERMGRMVSNMLLLARIGNQQFPASPIDWPKLFNEQLQALQDLVEEKHLSIEISQGSHCNLRLHPFLAELLVGNLLRNAVQHNVPNGTIRIFLNADGFTIENSGIPLVVPPSSLFDRFAKGDPSSSSTGLGLAMAQEIAVQNGMQLLYEHHGADHRLTVREA
ncbi:MAG: HAMP domain-containing histidine kinase [Flavobacteriales bacterium]|nr:HAMP domain-containing histidine kinase [Flavobacteriales bacterium]